MGKVMTRELVLVLVTGIFGGLAVPMLLHQPLAFPLFLVAIFLGLTFMPMHAVAIMLGKRLPETVRGWAGVFAWCFAFLGDFKTWLMVSATGGTIPWQTTLVTLAPASAGLALPMLAALRAPAGERLRSAAWAVYLFSLPMWIVRDVLARIVSQNLLLVLMAVLGGALYMFLHGLLRIYLPSPAEDEGRTTPLRERRPIPDAIVGLVEGTLHRRARPYATTEQGLDDTAISVLCPPDEVQKELEKLTAAFGDRPFEATRGQVVKGQVEIVVRQRN